MTNGLWRNFDHEIKRADFEGRQKMLAALAAFQVVLWLLSGFYSAFLAAAALFLQVATDEARRYRRTGCTLQTRRTIWKGTTPIDAAKRHLLGDWKYPNAVAMKPPERVEG